MCSLHRHIVVPMTNKSETRVRNRSSPARRAGPRWVMENSLHRQLLIQPCPRHRPIALDGPRRDAKLNCDFLKGQAGEEMHLQNLSLPWIKLGKPSKYLIGGQDINLAFVRGGYPFVERDLDGPSTAFSGCVRPRVIHQDVPHC